MLVSVSIGMLVSMSMASCDGGRDDVVYVTDTLTVRDTVEETLEVVDTVVVRDTLSPCNTAPDVKLIIFLNPTDGLLNLDVRPDSVGLYTYRIFDLAGRVRLLGYTSAAVNPRLDLSDYDPGVYLVRVELACDTVMERLVIR